MHHSLVNDIALCIVVAWTLAMVAHVARQPLILAYLLGGYLVGPSGLGWIQEKESIETISSLGLLFLLFMIGLEMDLKKMLRAGRLITLAALAQILGGFGLGLGVFWALGFPLAGGRLDALYLAIGATLSSTVIVVKILYDKREFDTLAGRITLGILVLQDLFAILFLALQPDLKHPEILSLLLSLGKVVLLVALALVASRYGLARLFHAVARLPELVLVGALAWCFMVAGLAGALGLSREMGALVAGVAISVFPYTLEVTAKVTGLRDFFVTLFFVALGMAIPAPTLTPLAWALGLAGFVILCRFVTLFPLLYKLRLGHRVSFLPALHLSQISEFSLVILAIGSSAQFQHVSEATRAIMAYAFVLLAVASTWGLTRSETILRWALPRLQRLGLPDLYHEDKAPAASERKPRIFLLGFFRTASSLLEELRRTAPELLPELAVVDFNPVVNQELRRRGVRVIYGDITQGETLHHAGVASAEIILCTVPNALLKGATNQRLVRQLRELNPTAQIIVSAEVFSDRRDFYAAGADYVSLARLEEARDLCRAIAAAESHALEPIRAEQARRLADQQEVLG